MHKRLFGIFSGTQLTVIACAAILAPSALYGAVQYSNVAVVNPATGHVASVDGQGRLSMVDTYGEYAKYPRNQIDIFVSNNGTQCETPQQWAVPAGKAFVITAISGYEYQSSTSTSSAGVFIFSGANCSGHVMTAHTSSVSQTAPAAPIVASYGVGIPIPAGSTVSVYSSYNFGYMNIHGYLVPAVWVTNNQYVPAAAMALTAKKGGPAPR